MTMTATGKLSACSVAFLAPGLRGKQEIVRRDLPARASH